jgi:hypothetical protein
MKLPKFTVHDVQTGLLIFVAAFVSTILKGGSVTTGLLLSAASAGVAAVVHTYLGKGA